MKELKSLVYVLAISMFLIGCRSDDGLIEVQKLDALVNYETSPIEGQYLIN